MTHWKTPAALLLALLLLSLCACGAQPEPLTQPQTTVATTVPTTASTTTAAPTTTEPKATEPASFSVDDVAMTATPDSSCFSEIGYSAAFETLVVTFRDSGKTYCYTNFSAADWAAFQAADSLGRYFNTSIKGKFPCEQV